MIVERRHLGSTQEWRSELGNLRCERAAREVLVFRPVGRLEVEFVDLFESFVDAVLVDTRPHLFWDGRDMTGYETEFRKRIGAYCVRIKTRVASMNVYAPNRFVAMGAAVINVWLGGFFTTISSVEDLEGRIRMARVQSR